MKKRNHYNRKFLPERLCGLSWAGAELRAERCGAAGAGSPRRPQAAPQRTLTPDLSRGGKNESPAAAAAPGPRTPGRGDPRLQPLLPPQSLCAPAALPSQLQEQAAHAESPRRAGSQHRHQLRQLDHGTHGPGCQVHQVQQPRRHPAAGTRDGDPRSGEQGAVGRWRRRCPHGAPGTPALPGTRGEESQARRSTRGPGGRAAPRSPPARGAEHRGDPGTASWGLLTSDSLGDLAENRSAPGSERWSWNEFVTINSNPQQGWCDAVPAMGRVHPGAVQVSPGFGAVGCSSVFSPKVESPLLQRLSFSGHSLWTAVELIPAAGITRVWQQHFIFTRKMCSKIKSS